MNESIKLLVTFDGYFGIEETLHGKQFRFNFDNYEGILHLPKLHPRIDTHHNGLNLPLSAPSVASDIKSSLPRFGLKISNEKGEINWGRTSDDSNPRYMNVKTFILEIIKIDDSVDFTINKNNQTEIRNRFLKWQKSFLIWIEVLTDQLPLNSVSIEVEESHIYFISNDEKVFNLSELHLQVKPPLKAKLIDENLFSKILELSCQLKMPHLVHSLLRDAKNALRSSDFRKCLVDIGTAVELALEVEIRKTLVKNINENYADNALQRATLGKKLEMLFLIKPPKELDKEKIKSDIINKRNNVIHRGLNYTIYDCKTALSLADEIIKTLNIQLIFESK